MILKANVDGAACYDVGDEIWQESLAEAIHAEADTIASYAGSDLLQLSDQTQRNAVRDRFVGEMTSALVSVGGPLPRTGRCSLLVDRRVCA